MNIDKECKDFENWAIEFNYSIEKDWHGCYMSRETEGAWFGWQACAERKRLMPEDVRKIVIRGTDNYFESCIQYNNGELE